ncbi:MAG TPA: hypothetical protein V6C71_03955 [Coleofasciculaceae cyanobacterium]|jgi:hypothetical protein
MWSNIQTKNDYMILPKADYEESFAQKLAFPAVADDDSIEASIDQRVRNIKSNLFDEYWSELLTYRQEIGARDTHESSRYYDSQRRHY